MNRLPPLIELRAFEAAARHVSFKKAAAELGVTPTAISHQIRLLEQYCGRALFRRRPRPLSLTEAGARLFPVVRDGLEAFSVALGAIRRQGDRHPLRVTTTTPSRAGGWCHGCPVGGRCIQMRHSTSSERTAFWTCTQETLTWRSGTPPGAENRRRTLPKSF